LASKQGGHPACTTGTRQLEGTRRRRPPGFFGPSVLL
jgi:hypothetical protein